MSHHLCGSNPSFLVAWNGNFGVLVPIGFFAAEVWIQANEEARLQRLAQRGSGVDAQLGRKMKLDFEAPGLSQWVFFVFVGGFFSSRSWGFTCEMWGIKPVLVIQTSPSNIKKFTSEQLEIKREKKRWYE
jgi:hypothetical protein